MVLLHVSILQFSKITLTITNLCGIEFEELNGTLSSMYKKVNIVWNRKKILYLNSCSVFSHVYVNMHIPTRCSQSFGH